MAVYGSLINSIGEAGENTWAVGDGCTLLGWSDRHAATVTAVSASGKRIEVKGDISTRTDTNGMSDCQTYEFAPNPDAIAQVYTLRKNGRWVKEGFPMKGGPSIGRGRSTYYDYSF